MNIILMSKNSIEPRRGMCGGGETTRNLITTRNPPLDVKGKETPEKLNTFLFYSPTQACQ